MTPPATPSDDRPTPIAGNAALVTGGGSGIGLACALALVADGCSVTITGRTEDRLRAGAEELRAAAAHGATVQWLAGDTKDESHVGEAVALAAGATGRLDHAIANAGRGGLGPIVSTPLEEWEDVIGTNLTGTFLVFKHAGAAIASAHAGDPPGSGSGSMVAISSIAGAVTHPFLGPYSVSKAAIDMLVRQTADELGVANVRVNSVRPGGVATDLMAVVQDEPVVLDSYLRNMPVSRFGRVEDVSAAVRFLLGPESSWVTGVSLSVDGGHHLRRGPDYELWARGLFGDAVDGLVGTEG